MQLEALGYVGIGTRDLDQWATYATRFLGMQLVERTSGTLALRMDDRKQRVIVSEDGGEGPSFYGWEVADAVALGALAARLEQAGVEEARGSRALADERCVKDLIVFHDPIGNRFEAFHGAGGPPEPRRPSPVVRSPASAPVRSAWGIRCSPWTPRHRQPQLLP